MRNKTTKNNKPIYMKGWFWIIIIVVMLFSIFKISGTKDETSDGTKQEEKVQTTQMESVCRTMTKKFVENVVGEDYSMLAFSVQNYDIDENGNGTIEVLYMPSNSGNDATKVNLTISKNENTYEITYALLAGTYEVDLEQVSENQKTFIYTE